MATEFPFYKDFVLAMKREYWRHAIQVTRGNACQMAKLTGANRTHIYKALKTLGMYHELDLLRPEGWKNRFGKTDKGVPRGYQARV